MVDSLYPPHSRLFVACDRDTTEEELMGEFQNYGSVVNVKLSRERSSGKPKGIAFVQFDKTSEAAAAIEGLDGKTVGKSTRPITVTVALNKDQSGSLPSSSPSQFLRLFLVVPTQYTEDDLHKNFSEFGTIDNVSIVKDRETKESKGYGYVKYKRFVDAAKAFEECDRSYKAVFAKPKEYRQGSSGRPRDYTSSGHEPYKDFTPTCTHIDDNPAGFSSLWALVSSSLGDDQIEWLFDIPPGLQYVRFFQDTPSRGYSSMYTRQVMAKYDSPGTAAYALRKLSGFEYPAGEAVQIKPNYDSVGNGARMSREPIAGPSVSALMQQVETLTNSLSEATRVIRSSGLASSIGGGGGQIDSIRCTAKLPPSQPFAPKGSALAERLFWVCEPGLPPQDALWDVFGRFGNLIEMYVLNGKNCGYAKYADKDSALKAVEVLNGQELYRMRMKVLVAEPQETRKRPRNDD